MELIIREAVKTVKKKRVAAYARVSMNTDMLDHSLHNQITAYMKLIQSNPEWEYVGVYADSGISGRSVKKREMFKKLIEDSKAGKIDMILVKSISRFARDTVDTLRVTRVLKDLGVDVFFEKEGIHSVSAEGELMLTLLAAVAQAESESIGDNVRWRVQKQFKKGIPNGPKPPYGYEWNGEMYVLIRREALVVQKIYDLYLSGKSAHYITKLLASSGIKGRKGVPLDESTVKDILSNMAYTGTGILGRTYVGFDRKRHVNKGERPMYGVKGLYEELIDKKTFDRAQEIRAERARLYTVRPDPSVFSGKLICGLCGGKLIKHGRRWVCQRKERPTDKKCTLKYVYEDWLMEAVDGEIKTITVYDEEFHIFYKNKRKQIWRYTRSRKN